MSRSVPRFNGPSSNYSHSSNQDFVFRQAQAPIQMRPTWSSAQNQLSPRRNSTFDFRPQNIVSSTRAVELHSAQRPTLSEVCPNHTITKNSIRIDNSRYSEWRKKCTWFSRDIKRKTDLICKFFKYKNVVSIKDRKVCQDEKL